MKTLGGPSENCFYNTELALVLVFFNRPANMRKYLLGICKENVNSENIDPSMTSESL